MHAAPAALKMSQGCEALASPVSTSKLAARVRGRRAATRHVDRSAIARSRAFKPMKFLHNGHAGGRQRASDIDITGTCFSLAEGRHRREGDFSRQPK
ncbi:hypothetical protein [Bradyrhizobium sp.]|uniref:hypothetical protein n=1 Tax=Bradyrhizobium sp. TaxID=376 RepID=UPI003C6F4BDD